MDDVVVTNLEREDGWALTLAPAPLSARNDAPQAAVATDRHPEETRGHLLGLDPSATTAFLIGSAQNISDASAATLAEDVNR